MLQQLLIPCCVSARSLCFVVMLYFWSFYRLNTDYLKWRMKYIERVYGHVLWTVRIWDGVTPKKTNRSCLLQSPFHGILRMENLSAPGILIGSLYSWYCQVKPTDRHMMHQCNCTQPLTSSLVSRIRGFLRASWHDAAITQPVLMMPCKFVW